MYGFSQFNSLCNNKLNVHDTAKYCLIHHQNLTALQ